MLTTNYGEADVERLTYQGHEIRIYQPSHSWKYAVDVDGHTLRSALRKLRIFTTIPGAVSAAKRFVRAGVAGGAPEGPLLEFQPELFRAHCPAGTYAIVVNYQGRPIGADTSRTHARTEYLAYFHPAQPREGEPRCELVHKDPARPDPRGAQTLSEAVEACHRHRAHQLAASTQVDT